MRTNARFGELFDKKSFLDWKAGNDGAGFGGRELCRKQKMYQKQPARPVSVSRTFRMNVGWELTSETIKPLLIMNVYGHITEM